MRVRFMLFSIERANDINRKFLWIGERLSKIFFSMKYELVKSGLQITSERYLTAAFFSALVYGIVVFSLLYGLFFVRDGIVTASNNVLAFLLGFVFFGLFFFLHLIYPGIMAKKYASGIDQSLMFALKSLLIQVSSGISLYDSMVTVSKAGYGLVSQEFETVIRDISAGESEAKALEKLALKTESEYLKKTSWQLLASLRSGTSLQGALTSIVQTVTAHQMRAIRDYASELNMWMLIYLLMAAVAPTLGITFLAILSAMGGASIGPEHLIGMIVAAFVMQVLLTSFIKTRIPKVYT